MKRFDRWIETQQAELQLWKAKLSLPMPNLVAFVSIKSRWMMLRSNSPFDEVFDLFWSLNGFLISQNSVAVATEPSKKRHEEEKIITKVIVAYFGRPLVAEFGLTVNDDPKNKSETHSRQGNNSW